MSSDQHIKRPMNAFMAWSKEERRKMVEEGSSLNNSLMSRILGHRWKQLGEEEKKAWKKTADKLKKEHAKMYPSYKYQPRKRNSGSSTVNLPPSPPSSSSSPSLQDTDQDDSLGSLEDLDLLDLAEIEDNGMQDIIEEVMSEDVENIPPPNTKPALVPRVMIPKLPQAVLAPRRGETGRALQTLAVSNTRLTRPGPGRPRKKPLVKTVYKRTDSGLELEREVDSSSLPPVKRLKLSQKEIMRLLGEDERKMKEQQVEEKVEVKTEEEEEEDKLLSLVEEDPPSVDKPRQFSELKAREAQYIGDMERLFSVFDELDREKNDTEQKHLEFMKKLDSWGPREGNLHQTLSGFSGDLSWLDPSGDLDLPSGWEDPELFSELDTRLLTESVFLQTWLPKFALKIRRDPYRALIRSINKKDPEFNIVW